MFLNRIEFYKKLYSSTIPYQQEKFNLKNYNPISVTLELTKKCINACEYCGVEGLDQKSMLEPSNIEKIIMQMNSLKIPSAKLTGGDPFLYSHLSSVINSCVNNGIEIEKINTTTRISSKQNHFLLMEELIKSGLGKNIFLKTQVAVGMGGQQKKNIEPPSYSSVRVQNVLAAIEEMNEAVLRHNLQNKIFFTISYYKDPDPLYRETDNFHIKLIENWFATYTKIKGNQNIKYSSKSYVETQNTLGAFEKLKIPQLMSEEIDWQPWSNCLNVEKTDWLGPSMFLDCKENIFLCPTWDHIKATHAYRLGNLNEKTLSEAAVKANNLPHIIILKSRGIRGLIEEYYLFQGKNEKIFMNRDVNEMACTLCHEINSNAKFYEHLNNKFKL